MGRKFSILVAFCVVLFGAILAGYWDMLDSQRMREARDQAAATLDGSASGSDAAKPNPSAASGTNGAETPPAAGADASSRTASAGNATSPAASSPLASDRPASVAPTFDVLRIEPDGSAVLAGRAMPNARIRLMDGATAIATAKASPEGDFAVVLDERLAPGDHQIRIEADKGDGVKTISEQTAIVSVPKRGDGGELLAMVETPNQPSRIINLPNADASPKPADATEPGAASAPASPPVAAEPAPSASAAGESELAAAPAARPAAAPPSPFAVEAVEIENGTIYVAGRAPGTAPVRVYVDNKFVGEDKARANDRFLVTAKVPLATGNHEIRADMIGGDGAVASRVEVPFAKPEGEAMSAIASNDGAAGTDGGNTSPAARTPSREDPAPANGTATDAKPDAANGQTRAADASAAGTPPTKPPSAPEPSRAANNPAADAPNLTASGPATEQASPTAPIDADVAAPSETAAAGAPAEAEQGSPSTVPVDDRIATIRQAPLEGVHTRVLIRRGDTLWRISRETYGQGRRYTVIYLANGDQIRNPNRIYPGQLFRLPKDDSKAID